MHFGSLSQFEEKDNILSNKLKGIQVMHFVTIKKTKEFWNEKKGKKKTSCLGNLNFKYDILIHFCSKSVFVSPVFCSKQNKISKKKFKKKFKYEW